MSKKNREIYWLNAVEDHDYTAAASYLALTFSPEEVTHLVAQLRKAKLTEFKAKDIFRASQLSLLGVSNLHVKKDQKKIKHSKELSPLLLVRDTVNRRVIIADGYHRLCAIYQCHEDIWIRCKIV
jgi:disulfide oxidoreductase YuzD